MNYTMIGLFIALGVVFFAFIFETVWVWYWRRYIKNSTSTYYDKEASGIRVWLIYRLMPLKTAHGTIMNDKEIVVVADKDNARMQRTIAHESCHVNQRRNLGKIFFWLWMFFNYVILFFIPREKKPVELEAEKAESKT